MAKLKSLICALCVTYTLLPINCLADDANEWFAGVGGLAAIYHSGATVSTYAGVIPGATAHVTNNITAIFDIGYNITPHTYAMLMGGYPPRPELRAKGSISALDDLGAVTYGPLVLTAGYRFPVSGRVHPYIGGGAAYAIILRDHDGAVEHLDVHNNFGYAAQAGVEYDMSERWQLYADMKQLWLNVHANGSIEGRVPVAARIQLNPMLLSVGIRFKL